MAAGGAAAWANYTPLTEPAQAASAQPWQSAAAAAASPSVGATPWSPALPQHAFAASASQPAAAAAASVAVGGKPIYDLGTAMVLQWQIQDDWGSWTDYGEAFNTILEKAYQEGTDTVTAKPGKAVTYNYYLGSFVQENKETSKRRTMRRMIIQTRMKNALPQIAKDCEEHNKVNHTLAAAHERTRPARARSRSVSRPKL